MNKHEKLRLLQGLIDPDTKKQLAQPPLRMRPIFVDPGHPSTVVVPGDPSPSPSRWLSPANGEISHRNHVRHLIRGEETLRAMRAAMDTATAPEHFIFLLGWSVTLDFPLSDRPGFTLTLGQILEDKVKYSKALVRALFWRQADEVVSALKRYGPLAAAGVLGMGATIGMTAGPLMGGQALLIGGAQQGSALAGLIALDRLGVKSRSILGMVGQNHKEVQFINDLPGAKDNPRRAFAALDKHHKPVGCHHQKILLVNGERGLIAFVGGIDVYPDRIWANGAHGSASLGSPYQDVHCQIEGPGAFDVLQLAIDRWRYSGAAGTEDVSWATGAKQVKIPGGRCSVQIGRTHGNPSMPGPKQTIKKIVLNAIEQAKRFIYLEDQYMVNLEAAAALNKAVPRIKHLTILIPHWKISDLPQCTYRRRKFVERVLQGLSDEDKRKVGVYSLGPNDTRFAYVHSKAWFIDDECAIIGSANCNRRGWESDSEVVAAVVEEVDPKAADLTFAHRARMDIWSKLLNVRPWQVHDGVASVVYWQQQTRVRGSLVVPYDISEADGFDIEYPNTVWSKSIYPNVYEALWDTAFDPPG